jgi:hypothetical protein
MIEKHNLVRDTIVSRKGEASVTTVIENGKIKQIELRLFDAWSKSDKTILLSGTFSLVDALAVIDETVEELEKRGFIGGEEPT